MMRRLARVLAVPALVLTVLVGGVAAPAAAAAGTAKVLGPPRCC